MGAGRLEVILLYSSNLRISSYFYGVQIYTSDSVNIYVICTFHPVPLVLGPSVNCLTEASSQLRIPTITM